METIKAGCFLVNRERKEIALIYRQKQKDFSFPKGHVEKGEEIENAAIRETAEETKRIALIVKNFEPFVERYETPKGEKCVCYMFCAIDNGPSDNNSQDCHDLIWTPFEEVENKLSYESLKNTWRAVENKIKTLL